MIAPALITLVIAAGTNQDPSHSLPQGKRSPIPIELIFEREYLTAQVVKNDLFIIESRTMHYALNSSNTKSGTSIHIRRFTPDMKLSDSVEFEDYEMDAVESGPSGASVLAYSEEHHGWVIVVFEAMEGYPGWLYIITNGETKKKKWIGNNGLRIEKDAFLFREQISNTLYGPIERLDLESFTLSTTKLQTLNANCNETFNHDASISSGVQNDACVPSLRNGCKLKETVQWNKKIVSTYDCSEMQGVVPATDMVFAICELPKDVQKE